MLIQTNNNPGMSELGTVNGGAALFLFSPHNINNHFKRSMQYNFGMSEVETLVDVIWKNDSLASNSGAIARHPNLNLAIVPSSDGFEVNTSMYSDCWTFMLIYDDDNSNNLIGGLTSNRVVALGVCSDEPISHQGIHAAVPEQYLNHNCQLIITKSMSYKRTGTLGANGTQNRVTTISDTNVVNAHNECWGSKDLFTMSSEDAILNCEIGQSINDDSATIFPDMSASIKDSSKGYIDTIQETPKGHLRNILSQFESGINQEEFSKDGSRFTDWSGMVGSSTANFTENVKSSFYEASNLSRNIIDTSAPILNMNYLTIEMFMSNYHPKLEVFQIPQSQPFEVIDQREPSITNVFSSMVCACIPAYLNDIGLNAIDFVYNSAAAIGGAFQIYSATSLHELSNQQLQHKAKSLITLCKTDLFPILESAGGDFELNIHSEIGSNTAITLHFLDNIQVNSGIYCEETMLGGAVSPLVGRTHQLTHNAMQLDKLITTMGDTITHKNSQY